MLLKPDQIFLSNWLLEGNSREEDEETLKGHEDGEDVGQWEQHFIHDQYAKYPGNPHDQQKERHYFQPGYDAFSVHLSLLLLPLTPQSNSCHYQEANVGKYDHHNWCNEGPDKIGFGIQKTANKKNN